MSFDTERIVLIASTMDRGKGISQTGSSTQSFHAQKENECGLGGIQIQDLHRNQDTEKQDTSLHNEENGTNTADLEALSQVPTGRPIHSIFTKRQKYFIVFMASWGGFFSPLTANIYFPALNALSADLHVSSTLINLTLTSYMIFQGLAPSCMGDLADMAGRRPVYVIGFTIYIAADVGLALQESYPALFVLRCVQSSGSSAMIALAYGVVADVASSSERGSYMGFANLGTMIGPAFGPVLGGVLSQFLGWKAIFWFLTIIASIYIVVFIITFPETGRNVVGNGSIPPPKWNMSIVNYWQSRKAGSENDLQRTVSRESHRRARAELASRRKIRWPNPLKTLKIVTEKDAGTLLLYNSLVYTAFYCVISSIPSIFAEIYSFNDLQIGMRCSALQETVVGALCFVGLDCYVVIGNRAPVEWKARKILNTFGMKSLTSSFSSIANSLTLGLSFIPFGVGCCAASVVNGKSKKMEYKKSLLSTFDRRPHEPSS